MNESVDPPMAAPPEIIPESNSTAVAEGISPFRTATNLSTVFSPNTTI